MKRLLRFPSSVRRDDAVELWMRNHSDELGTIARRWFEVMRACGDDVRELMHDGQPTACVGDAAFGYVAVFGTHVNVGFFPGSEMADPQGVLEGAGKFMRHVKLTPGRPINPAVLTALIEAAYLEIKRQASGAAGEP